MEQVQKKVLVVDDDRSVLRLVEEMLRPHGLDIATAQDGLDAMVMVKKVKPDLIILDIMMPELNGYEVCHNLKFDEEYKHIPIIILTVRDQEIDPKITKFMGIDYLHKPFHADELIKTVFSCLDPKTSGA